MSLLTIVLTLVVIGVVLYLISLVPMDARIKNILNIVVIIFVILWLLKAAGLWDYLSNVRI